MLNDKKENVLVMMWIKRQMQDFLFKGNIGACGGLNASSLHLHFSNHELSPFTIQLKSAVDHVSFNPSTVPILLGVFSWKHSYFM